MKLFKNVSPSILALFLFLSMAPTGHAATPKVPPAPEAPATAPSESPPAVEAVRTENDLKIPSFKNMDEISRNLNLSQFRGKSFSRKIKIAVLDNGFRGYEQEIGKGLPANTVYHQGKASDADQITSPTFHGLMIAKIISQIIQTSQVESDYELHLFNTFGYTKFADAVETVIADKFDLVVYAQVWEYGGNGDTKGFINALVDKAVNAGIVWLNAAGDFGQLTRVAPISSYQANGETWVVFTSAKGRKENGVVLKCEAPKDEQCTMRVVLSWNDFKDTVDEGTDKDLDLLIYDSKKNLLMASERNQKLEEDESDKLASLIPRELIETQIPRGNYVVRVKVKSDNFSEESDKLRLTVSGNGMSMKEFSRGETLLPPADNAGVITIGSNDEPNGSTSQSQGRPDVTFKSLIQLSDGSSFYSTSIATAFAGGLAALYVGTGTDVSREAVLEKLKTLGARGAGRSADAAGAGSGGAAGSGSMPSPGSSSGACYMVNYNLPMMYPFLNRLLQRGDVVPATDSSGQYILVSRYDFGWAYGILRNEFQRIYVTPNGPVVIDIRQTNMVPWFFVEVRSEGITPFCQSSQLRPGTQGTGQPYPQRVRYPQPGQ